MADTEILMSVSDRSSVRNWVILLLPLVLIVLSLLSIGICLTSGQGSLMVGFMFLIISLGLSRFA